MGLAPHTSAGVLARVIGVSKAPVGYAHPYFHAAKRRNCFAADTMIEVFDGAEWRSLPIGHFVVENFDLERPELDQVGTYYSDPKASFWVHALDTNGMIHLRQVTSVSVHQAPEHLIRFTTCRGKQVTVTPDHAMLVSDLAYQRKIRAMELKEGDTVPVFDGQMMITDTIQTKEYIPNLDEYVYCLTVAVDHTLAANGIFTGQCDGDEDCVMLLMDGLLNFSRAFLPETRGGSMDAPLVLTSKLDPAEVDGESHNVDACRSYPIELYEAALEYRHPKELAKIIDHLGNRWAHPGSMKGWASRTIRAIFQQGRFCPPIPHSPLCLTNWKQNLILVKLSGRWMWMMSQNGYSKPISSRICRAISTHFHARNSGARNVMPNTAGCQWQGNAGAAERLSRPFMKGL